MNKQVWVVTFGALGEEKGEFFREEAYRTKELGTWAAHECMKQHGRADCSFTEDNHAHKPDHVERSWSNGYTTIWLETLTVVE